MFQTLFPLIVLAFGTPNVTAAEPANPATPHDIESFANLTTMNDINFSRYFEFWKRWQLVTARYREDSHEMRLVYANTLAWDTISKGRTDYQKGAVFAKIGFQVNQDAAFPSSLVPNGPKRVQFMVRGSEKYQDTDGWGYAIFDGNGKTFAGDPKLAAQACAACHKLVAERAFVFSQPLDTVFGPRVAPPYAATKAAPQIAFQEQPLRNLPGLLLKLLPANSKVASSVTGPLQHFTIAGTLDEIRPALIREAKAKNRPALLLHDSGDGFSAVWPDDSQNCPKDKSSFSGLISYPLDAKRGSEAVFKLDHFCV